MSLSQLRLLNLKLTKDVSIKRWTYLQGDILRITIVIIFYWFKYWSGLEKTEKPEYRLSVIMLMMISEVLPTIRTTTTQQKKP